MAENLDDKATRDLAQSRVNIESARKIGFRDGFVGTAARAISDGVDQQTAYLDAFKEGRDHRDQTDEVCAAEGIDIAVLMRKAFDFYYQAHYSKDFIDLSGVEDRQEKLDRLAELKLEAVAQRRFEDARAIRDQADRIRGHL